MPTEHVCLSALRHISSGAAAILDRYSSDQAVWAPATSFRRFFHTLCWGDFADLDLRLLESLEPTDRSALLEELHRYHENLRRQRERVNRFHHAYRRWLGERERELPRDYVERLRHWRRRFGAFAYFHITGLATRSGFQQFMTDPAGHMAAFERAFAELEQEEAEFWQSGVDAGRFSGERRDEPAGMSAQIAQALHLLELPAQASLTEIRQAYRQHAKMLHPDWHGEKRSAQMAALNSAYQALCAFHRLATADSGSHRNERRHER